MLFENLRNKSRNETRNPKSECTRWMQPTAKPLTESLELHLVASQPGGLPGSSLDSVSAVSLLLSQSTSLASGAGESTHFAVLVGTVDDPVDARIVADLLVARIDTDNFVVFHCSILVDPV